MIRLDFPNYLFIEISELYSLFSKGTHPNNNADGNFVLPLTTNSQSLEIFNRHSMFNLNSCYMSSNITTLTIKLKTDTGVIADLNQGDWSLLLGLIYKE